MGQPCRKSHNPNQVCFKLVDNLRHPGRFLLTDSLQDVRFHTLLTSCLHAVCTNLLKHVWNKPLTTWNKLVGLSDCSKVDNTRL